VALLIMPSVIIIIIIIMAYARIALFKSIKFAPAITP
jgi:hypothetical protein